MFLSLLIDYLPIIALYLLLVALAVFALAACLQHRGFYGRTNCSICGQPTGFKENKRYKLIGGCACESCATKLIGSKDALDPIGPNWFMINSPFGTVDDATKFIKRLEQDETEVVQPEVEPTQKETLAQHKMNWTSKSNNMK